MFAESIHSVADTVNQIILAFGLHRSAKVSIQRNLLIFESRNQESMKKKIVGNEISSI